MRLRSVSAFQQVIRGGGCPERVVTFERQPLSVHREHVPSGSHSRRRAQASRVRVLKERDELVETAALS